MAEVKLDFTAQTEELRAGLQQTRDLLVQIQDAQKANNQAIQQDANKNVQAAEKFNSTLESSLAITSQLGKQGLGDLKKGLDNATQSAESFEEAGTSAGDALDSTFKSLVSEATKAAKAQGVVVTQISKGKAASIDLLKNIGAITAEEAELAKQATAVLDSMHAQGKAGDPIVKNAVSLRTQVKLAREELDRLVEASNGKITPELAAAAQKAGLLQDRMEDLATLTTAFNPDKKFQAFANVLGNVANGFQAATAAAGLFGDQSEDLTRALLKIQQTVAFVQGLQGFLGGLGDNLKSIRALIVANTVAIEASTVATTEDAAAKTADAVATDAAAVSTGGFTVALQGLKAALLSNPLTALLVVLTAAIAAMIAFASETENATEAYSKLRDQINGQFDVQSAKIELKNAELLRDMEVDRIKRLSDAESGKRKDADLTQKEIEAERVARKKLDDLRTQNLLKQQAADNAAFLQLQGNFKTVFDKSGNQIGASAKQRQNLILSLGLTEKATDEEIIKSYMSVQDEKRKALVNTAQQITEIETQQLKEENDRAEQRIAIAKAEAKALLQVWEAYAAAVDDLNKKVDAALLNSRLADLQLAAQEAEDQGRIEEAKSLKDQIIQIRQDQADAEVEVLRKNLLLKRAAVELEKRMTVAALSDLTDKQKEILEQGLIDTGAVKLGADQLAQLDKLITLNAYNAQKERTANAIDETAKRIALDQSEAAAAISVLEQYEAFDIAQAQNQVGTEEEKHRKILLIQIEYAKKEIQLLEATGKLADATRAEQLKATIDKLEKELNAVPQTDIFKLLGLGDISKEEKKAIEEAVGDVLKLANAAVNAQAIQVQAQIDATDAIIADRERRSQDLQTRLTNELALAQAGYASNVDLVRQQIAENDAAAAAEKKRRADLLADQKKVAREQLVLDSITQASALATAASKIFVQGALVPGGVFLAIGLIASMIAAFVSIKAKAKAISEGPSFGEGDWIKGPSHKNGGVPIVAEGGEFMVRKREAKKFPKVLEGINENDWTKERQRALLELMDSAGVKLSLDEADKFVAVKREFVNHNTINNSIDNTRLERKVERLTNEVIALRGDGRNKPGTSVVNGKVITTKPGRTVRNG